MSNLSEKELSGLTEMLNEEELLIKKFQMLAGHTQDKEIIDKFNEIAKKHQGHFDELYKQLG